MLCRGAYARKKVTHTTLETQHKSDLPHILVYVSKKQARKANMLDIEDITQTLNTMARTLDTIINELEEQNRQLAEMADDTEQILSLITERF